MTKDYARKNWVDARYKDWMHRYPAKAVWNNVLVKNPDLAEFSGVRYSSQLDAVVARYMKQSEFKRVNTDESFPEMELNFNVPPGFSHKSTDQPWNIQIPIDPTELTETVFDAEVYGGWCEDDIKTILIRGTHPIYLLTITYGDEDTFIANIQGYGTNAVSADIYVPAGNSGFVTIEASMTSFQGVSGDSNVNVFEFKECEGDESCTSIDGPGNWSVTYGSTWGGSAWTVAGVEIFTATGGWNVGFRPRYMKLTVDSISAAQPTTFNISVIRAGTQNYSTALSDGESFYYNFSTSSGDISRFTISSIASHSLTIEFCSCLPGDTFLSTAYSSIFFHRKFLYNSDNGSGWIASKNGVWTDSAWGNIISNPGGYVLDPSPPDVTFPGSNVNLYASSTLITYNSAPPPTTDPNWHDGQNYRIYIDFTLAGGAGGEWGSGQFELWISSMLDLSYWPAGVNVNSRWCIVNATKIYSGWTDSDYDSKGSTLVAGPFSIAAGRPYGGPALSYAQYIVPVTTDGMTYINSRTGQTRNNFALISYEYDWLQQPLTPSTLILTVAVGGPYPSENGTNYGSAYGLTLSNSIAQRPKLRLTC